MLPVVNNLAVEVTDSAGISSILPCVVKVKKNAYLKPLDFYLEKEFDPQVKLLLISIIKSNKNEEEKENDSQLNDKALDFLEYYLSNFQKDVQKNIENILAKIIDISKQKFTVEKHEIVNQTIEAILKNTKPLLHYIEKMQNVYRLLDNLFIKASFVEEFKSDKSLLDKMQGYLDQLNSKLFKNVVNGQALFIQNQNCNTQ